jgi:uncharacterized membrane protein YsdA (DUF1294 family)
MEGDMMELRQFVLGYLLLINSVGFLIMGFDKYLAIKQRNRITEKTLLSLCILGGSIGSWISMQLFRHKTRKPLFNLGIPLVFLIEYGALTILLKSFPPF